MNVVKWARHAERQLEKLSPQDAEDVFWKVDNLEATWPKTSNVIKLVNRPEYRLRVGRFRVFFTPSSYIAKEPGAQLVTILRIEEVLKRDERTYS